MGAPSSQGEAVSVDLPAERLRLLGLLLLAFIFTAGCVWMLQSEFGGRRAATPGSFRQFLAVGGVILFGLGIPLCLRELLRRGPIVSVSAKGLFDRRLSTDWIPWPAILVVDVVEVGKASFLRLRVPPDQAATLPWTRRGRRIARLNGVYGGGYWIAGHGVRGGIPAIVEAMARVRANATQDEA